MKTATQALADFGKACGLALAARSLPDDVDVQTATDAQLLEAVAVMLDRLDEATDEFLAERGSEHRVERTMQAELRRIAINLTQDQAIRCASRQTA